MNVNQPRVQIEEVTSVLAPADGVSVEQALKDANIGGFEKVDILNGKIIVTWFKRKVA